MDLAKIMVILASAAALLKTAQGFVINTPEMMVSIMDTVSIVTEKEQQRQDIIDRYRKPRAIEDKSDKAEVASGPVEDFSADIDDEIPF
jgi:hypothetical protein